MWVYCVRKAWVRSPFGSKHAFKARSRVHHSFFLKHVCSCCRASSEQAQAHRRPRKPCHKLWCLLRKRQSMQRRGPTSLLSRTLATHTARIQHVRAQRSHTCGQHAYFHFPCMAVVYITVRKYTGCCFFVFVDLPEGPRGKIKRHDSKKTPQMLSCCVCKHFLTDLCVR